MSMTTHTPSENHPSSSPATDRWVTGIRWAAGIVFVVFGIGKFVNHASELASFRQYSLPAPGASVYLIGVLGIGGGMLLAGGLLVKAAALALAIDMIGAIVVSGVGQGESISLTLAPLLLVAMIFLIRFGGRGSVDRSLPARLTAWRRRSAA